MVNSIEIPLFFGFELDESLKIEMGKLNPYQESFFLHDQTGNYLQELVFEDNSYLGKWIGAQTTLHQLLLTENHIYSIIKKVVISFDSNNYPLKLIPIPQIPAQYVTGK